MKSRSLLSMSIAAAALLTSGISLAAPSDPLIPLYRVSGVTDNGGADNVGKATSFNCTNWGAVPEALQIVIRNFGGSIVIKSETITIGAKDTVTISTHFTALFVNEVNLDTGAVGQGSASIRATSVQFSCTAMIVDAAGSGSGIALHMVRLNAASGTQE